MKKGNAVTAPVNYGEGMGTFGVVARKAREGAITFDTGIDVPLFSCELSKLPKIGIKSTFRFASTANDVALTNTADGVNNQYKTLA